ncbi:PfkB family carbohydrate kinase [Bacillus pakistanensis]
MYMLDVVTFGESMVLFSPERPGRLRHVHTYSKQLGGAESNVAIGLSRLGVRAGWFSKLGRDEFGYYIQSAIQGEGVDTSRVLFDEQAPTGLYLKEYVREGMVNVMYYRHMSAASQMSPSDLDESYIASAKILHITGITPALSSSCAETVEAAIDIARHHGVKIVFDPNIRLKLFRSKEEARAVLREIADKSDIVLAGKGEGEVLTGDTDVQEIASEFHRTGVKTVVIKMEDKGAYYSSDAEKGMVEAFSVKQVIDPVGAGDGFAAGFLASLLREEGLKQAVKAGNAVGAMMVQSYGDMEGLPTWDELEEFLNKVNDTEQVRR